MDAIAVRELDFSYGSSRILKKIDLTVPEGRFAVLLGENGAGKSTFLKLLLGELPIGGREGKILLFGRDIRQFKSWQELSCVPQSGMASYQNFPASAEEVVQANLYARIGRFRFAGKKEKEQVRQALIQVGMEDFAKRLIGRLSGGQQQRILLARALVNRPRLLILDEPSSGMDEKSTEHFYRLLKHINQKDNVTILMVTHDRKRLEPFADDIWLLEEGTMELVKTGMEIFNYGFMQRAFLVGLLLAAVIPCIGMVIVCKRLSMIGDALSHTSLAGVAAGLILGMNPVAAAALACITASLGIEIIRRKLPRYSEMSIAIVMSAGVGLAGVLSGFVKNAANFNSFLFGSIVAISDTEMYLVVGVSAAVLLLFLLMYKELFYISLDEQSARLAGVPVRLVNFLFTLLIAVTVSVSARTVGALIVSSMMVVPVACAMQFGRNYRQTILWAVGLDMIFMTTGLFAAYYLGLKPGGAIVLSGVAFLILVFTVKKLLRIFLK